VTFKLLKKKIKLQIRTNTFYYLHTFDDMVTLTLILLLLLFIYLLDSIVLSTTS